MPLAIKEMPREELEELCVELFASLAGRNAQIARQAELLAEYKQVEIQTEMYRSNALFWKEFARDKLDSAAYVLLERLYNTQAVYATHNFADADYDNTGDIF